MDSFINSAAYLNTPGFLDFDFDRLLLGFDFFAPSASSILNPPMASSKLDPFDLKGSSLLLKALSNVASNALLASFAPASNGSEPKNASPLSSKSEERRNEIIQRTDTKKTLANIPFISPKSAAKAKSPFPKAASPSEGVAADVAAFFLLAATESLASFFPSVALVGS